MKRKKTIGADTGPVIILFVCVAMLCAQILLGYGERAVSRHSIPPKLILLLCVLGLCLEWKAVHLSHKELCVHYCMFFYTRRIPWDRINSVELVLSDRCHYLFISLDNCPSFCEVKEKPAAYMLKHPIKLIYLQIDGKKIKEYKQMISEYFPNAAVIDKTDGTLT